MNWDAIGAIGEVTGALLVAFTLMYLMLQIRQNSASISATTNQANLTGFNHINTLLAEKPMLAAILEKGSESPHLLSDIDSTYVELVEYIQGMSGEAHHVTGLRLGNGNRNSSDA